ncbi:polysaccharide biosynthesis protein [Dactylosporangium sp. CA-139066]|uniref:polysaccharide biosynthesis protein n=1 Tax=Dactylosporangium sp. CA-139066 TaxID=3239930 RepID=UPI003D90D0AD
MDDHRPAGPGDWPADLYAWTGGIALAAALTPVRPTLPAAAGTLLLALALHSAVAWPVQLYRRRYEFASAAEARALIATASIACGLLVALAPAPRAVSAIGGAAALLLMLAGRWARAARRRTSPAPRVPVLIYGAGAAGHRLLAAMQRDPHCGYRAAGFLDDDPDKHRLRISGVAVLGGRESLRPALTATGAAGVIFAIRNTDGSVLRALRDDLSALEHRDMSGAARHDISDLSPGRGKVRYERITTATSAYFVKVLPSLDDSLDRPVSLGEMRDVELADLLGRRQIDTDLAAIGDYLTGRRVLVTGAGGSIGSELCRQLHRFAPAELMMLDRDESALHAVQLSIHGRALLDDPSLILADLRDAATIRAVFEQRRPEVVFHAAALKHLTLLERHPAEAVQTNVLGTLNVLEAAAATGVRRLVNISTDKAAGPVSVLGYSKRITERLTAHHGYLNVRFGNVLGSRGSVVTAFRAQIAAGGPVTVTDPEVTRYFMTVPEAVQLVIQAAAIGAGGEALVLDMGAPVRIADLARQLIAGAPVEIVYTGLRPGEKRHEELFGPGEADERPLHPLVSHVQVPPLDPALARALNPAAPPPSLIGAMADLCVVPAMTIDEPTLSAARTS